MTKFGEVMLRQFLQAEAAMLSFGARFILAAGRSYHLRLLDHRYGAGEKQSCFRNALELALVHPELTYCEGRAMTELPVPVEHAWCVTVDGLVVDTTWAPSEASYFGVAFETDFVNDHVESQRRYAVLAAMLPRRLLEKDPADFLAAPSHEQLEAVRQMQLEMRRDLVRL